MLFWTLVGAIVFLVARAFVRATRDEIREYINGGISGATAFWTLVMIVGFITMVVNALRYAWTLLP